ncbi:MAG TPA: TonB-dependent receptor [Longimicrobiaceae bacterium]|nr:TonB-dependent receptor [Longimicrobiaceae bacterium]
MLKRTVGAVCVLAVLPAWVPAAAAQSPPAGTPAPYGAAVQQGTGSVVGMVTDAVTGQPISGVQVRLRELGRSELSHADGSFHFERLPAGRYTVTAQRIGYASAERVVRVVSNDSVAVPLTLTPSAIAAEAIVVTGTGRERGAQEAYRPTSVVGGAELRRELGSSVAATLQNEPGISQRYNGPAAAQPVIRGLGGDRVLVLEDGGRTGDIASSSGDHAVTVDPVTAERIEVVRGPAALLYGSNALGGVVNVIREEVPRTLPERLTGTASVQGETVNQGLTGGFSAVVPVGSVALRAEASGRTAGDTRTPLGVLPSTQMDGYNAAAGASWIQERGFVGVSVRDLAMEYGVPGDFQGVVIPGGHEGGARIDLHRTSVRLEAERVVSMGPIRAVKVDGGYSRYEHTEREPDGAVGSRFGQLTGRANVAVRHQHEAGGLLSEGAFGAWAYGKDFAVAGSSTGSEPARQASLAGFVFEELLWGPVNLQAGARYDWSRVTPRETGRTAIGLVRPRDFGAFSASVAALFRVADGWWAGASVARAFRTPSIEELFSNGPHLADFSFNVGNPDLDSEFGLGTDVFVRARLPRLTAELTAFRNDIDNYIYYAPTGELDPRFGRFPVYQARGDDAVLTGVEGRLQWEAVRRLVLDGNASYVRGTLQRDGSPLPAIPPLHGGLNVRYDTPTYFVGLGWEGAAEQDRVARDEGVLRERPTDGYSLFNGSAGLRWTAWGRLNTLTLQVRNVTDEAWRDHLSRIKEVAPQPGRNVQLLYRVNF